MKNILLTMSLLCSMTILVVGQGKPIKYKQLANGLSYHFYEGKPKSKKSLATKGDRIIIQSEFRVAEKLLSEPSSSAPKLIVMHENIANENAFLYELPMQGLQMMHAGDSAQYRILVKDFFKSQSVPVPEGWKEQDTLFWNIKALAVETRKDYCKRVDGLRKINQEFLPVDDYLEYKFVQLGKGGYISDVGDLMMIHVNYKIGDSTVFRSATLDEGKALPQQITPPGATGDLMKGFMLMQEGDSAIFRIRNHHYTKTNPHNIHNKLDSNEYHYWEVRIDQLKSQKQVEEDRKAHIAQQHIIDSTLIDAYLLKNELVPTVRQANGLVYVVKENGTGSFPTKGARVKVNYTGMFLDGVKFDSSVDPKFNHVEPFVFELGKKQVIAGWDEGLQLMKKGERGLLLVPSTLGYGSRSQGPIPENAVLVFEVELVDIL